MSTQGTLSHELEVNVAAREAWELFGTLRLAKLMEKQLSDVLSKIDLIEGDGGVGTVLKLTFVPGIAGISYYKEKFTKIDDEKRVKETEVVEGGFLEMGFKLYRVRLEVIEKSENSCITKATIEYELNEDAPPSNASFVTIHALQSLLEAASTFLTNNKTTNELII